MIDISSQIELQKDVVTPTWVNLLSSIAYSALGFLSFALYRIVRKQSHPFRKFLFRIKGAAFSLQVIYATIPKDVDGKKIYFIEEGDATALYNLVDYTSEIVGRKNLKVNKHEDVLSSLSSIPYFISISGPIYNKITALYLEKSGFPYAFNLKNKTIENYVSGVTYTTEKKNNILYSCHGMLICSNSVTTRGTAQRYMICCGNSSLSTYVATIILYRILHDKKFRRLVKYNVGTFNGKWGLVFNVINQDCDIESKSAFMDEALHYEIIDFVKEGSFV